MADIPSAAEPSVWANAVAAADLERRVARLEEAVEAIVHTTALEDRVVERVQQRLAEEKGANAADAAAPRPDAETSVARADTAGAAVSHVPHPPPGSYLVTTPPPGIVREMGRELRLFFHMLRDPRFHVSWGTKLFPLLAILYITVWPLLSGDWLGPLSKPLWLYPLDLLMAYIALKIIGRDLRRYEWHLARRRP